ncbi:MAG: NADH-quinone oxidoreductase subunit NuoF [Chloroflexi bacterium]|nr:MAG: NADH-quinone oxidoreductase subunit NuoF [Chloroflexota bacterium]
MEATLSEVYLVPLPPQRDGPPPQTRVLLQRAGRIDPEAIEEYLAYEGYTALGKALSTMTPAQVVEEVQAAGLLGRGGAAFPTGLKMRFVAQADRFPKYVLCNADESEPGTFKDRILLEGDPHAVLEGMAIAGYAVGAHEGYIYIRGEYDLARQRLETAIRQAEEKGLLGERILGTDFSFHIHIHSGAGAYICGEETALIESLEGKRGEPRLRPPYPTTHGLWGQPTLVQNVETLANVPVIIREGAAGFRRFGTEDSPGTKLYCLVGDVNSPGVVEAPMGITLRELIQRYGGGMRGGKRFKLVQTGGSAGTILDARVLDVPLTYPALREAGGSLGSGALLVGGEETCVVDLVRVVSRFFKTESCGKCVPCRLGTLRAYEILEGLGRRDAHPEDLAQLERIATYMATASFCGLGQTAAVPILTGLRHFREEFEAHAVKKTCPTGRCNGR